jgi:hypothetical protein
MRRLLGCRLGDRRMPLHASADAARANRRRGSAPDGVTFWHTLYLGTSRYNMKPGEADPAADALFPMAFLVEQDPGSTAQSHFHQQDQFQLVVNGNAMMGTHAVQPLSVHFSGAFTAYGPIRASNDKGVWYFTLRNGFDPGARFMMKPENRAALRAIPGRKHREAVNGPLGDAEVAIPQEADGMGAWRYRLGAGEQALGPDPASGRGQYWVVANGSMICDGTELPRLSCSFVKPDEAPLRAVAGSDGLDVVVMQFPRHDR